MKEFKLQKIRYKNILSVGQKSIEISLSDHHKTLITGKNGHGKSTLLEALTFGLFGRSFRDIKKAQLINTYNKKDLLVEVWLSYCGNEYYVKRGQKPNILEIKKNGELLNELSSVKDFQESFETMIGMTYASFKQVVVLGTAGYTPFMQLTPLNRRKMVEDLLEVTVLANMDKANKTYIRDLNQKIQMTDANIVHIKNDIQTHLDYAEKQKKFSGDNLKRLQDIYDSHLNEVNQIKLEVASLKENLIQEAPVFEYEKLNQTNNRIISLSNDISSSKKVVDLYAKGGKCVTCLQELSNEGLTIDIKNNIERYEKSKESMEKIRDDLKKQELLYHEYQNQTRDTEKRIEYLKSNAVHIIGKMKKIKAAIEQASNDVIDNSDKIELRRTHLAEEIENKSDFLIEKYNRSIVVDMLKDSGIKSSIVKKYIPLFNKKINHYLKLLEADYVFNLDEEFNENIKSRGRENFIYYSFSQGERGRIDLALMFTWRDIAEIVSKVRISGLFLDEVTDSAGLDADGYKNLTTIIDSMKDFNFFVISHKEQDTSKYNRHITMRKVGRFTTMEEL